MAESAQIHRFTRVEFNRFKAFKRFKIDLKQFNVMVGPNNAGKSTVLVAFRILAAALRGANARKPIPVGSALGLGYNINLSAISVAEENIFFNYDESNGAEIIFHLSNKNTLKIHFTSSGACFLVADAQGHTPRSPAAFRKQFNCKIGFVPILGPVEHREALHGSEAARLALFNYRAARNFRNIWYHFPEQFSEFRDTLKETWPGMDILSPELDTSHSPPLLHMFCPEGRIPRELFWSGFGFQVWCQMLTHLIKSADASIFLIDEPDIYLHSELQRQLLGLLRNLGPDILIATHSTEIITEAETDEIILINKQRNSSRRLHNPSQLGEVFGALGSNTNPVLTQLAKTRRVIFVEGKDFQIIGKFARKLGEMKVSNRRDFAVVPVDGFNPEKIRILIQGMEATLGEKISAIVILDRDYRSENECIEIVKHCTKFCDHAKILKRKEIENFLMVPSSIDRAIRKKIAEQTKRTGHVSVFEGGIVTVLNGFVDSQKSYITSQYLSKHRQFTRIKSPKIDASQQDKIVLEIIEKLWVGAHQRLKLISGKEALSEINKYIQKHFGVSITPTAIIDSMRVDEVPTEMRELVCLMRDFSTTPIKH